MSLTRSVSTGELVWVSGSRYVPAPGPRWMRCSGGVADVPGLQSMYFSPSSDCGRIAQNALAWKGVKPALLIVNVTAALQPLPGTEQELGAPSPLRSVTSVEPIVPTGAPAIRTSSPGTANEASSNIARIWYGSP